MTWDNSIAWLMLAAAGLYLVRRLIAWWQPAAGTCGGCHGCASAKAPSAPVLQLVPLNTELAECSVPASAEAETSR